MPILTQRHVTSRSRLPYVCMGAVQSEDGGRDGSWVGAGWERACSCIAASGQHVGAGQTGMRLARLALALLWCCSGAGSGAA